MVIFMAVVSNVNFLYEPTDLQCGQAVLAMLSGLPIEKVIEITGTDRETTLKQMFSFLDKTNIKYSRDRVEVEDKSQLSEICILSLETPRCWHWSLYFKGKFYDPEHGVLEDFPLCKRKYYWEILK